MKLNHLNLSVPDVSQSRAFFETYFGFRCVAERGRNTIAVLVGEDGFVLTLSNFEHTTTVEYPSGFHVGFILESRERVNAMYDTLKEAGFEAEPPRVFHGSWTFYLQSPGGVLVEVMSQLGDN